MNFEEMSLLDQIIYDGAEVGSMVMHTMRGPTLYLLRLPDRGEDGHHLYVIPDWENVEESIIGQIEEELDEDGEGEDGESFVDIFWDMMEEFYVGCLE